MNPKKIMVIFGTRPEATKMCPVVRALRKHPEWFDTRLVVTGQHREQLHQALSNFGLEPDVDLGLMKDNQTLSYITTAAISGIDQLILADKPDLVLVHGDTQTSISGALTAFFHKVPLGHVEAGLRSYNKFSPWPEEVNRKVIDVMSDILFAPTRVNRDNLIREGYKDNIYVTGQTAVDAALLAQQENYTFKEARLNILKQPRVRVITVTAHRRENYGPPMQQMFRAILRIADNNSDVLLVYPVHLSPRVREAAFGILSNHERILLLDPIEFPDMVNLLSRSYMILSDSGGLQEESTVFHKPMVLMRDTTERPEAVEAGVVYLSGTEEESIYNISMKLLSDDNFYKKMASAKNPFGDGRASERIVDILAYYFGYIPNPPEEFMAQ